MIAVPFALQFTGSVDPAALVTLVLAVVTVALLVVVIRALHLAHREVDRWRDQVEQSHRPVVVPIHSTMQMPVFQGHGELLVPIENIGSGPALDIHLLVTPRDENGGVSPAWGEVKHTGAASGLAVAKTTPVEVRAWGLGGLTSFDVWVTYLDLAGRQWVTSAKYLASEQGSRYTNLWVAAVPDGQTALAWLGFE
ncbi:MAG: hypothetical protein ACXVEW_12505 [Solirubrobacteraceae bacterium]